MTLILPELAPLIDDVAAEIIKEQSYLSGAKLLLSGGDLTNAGKKEVQEEIDYSQSRLNAFAELRYTLLTTINAVNVLKQVGFPVRVSQFASQSVIDEFKRLVQDVQIVFADFEPEPPTVISINSTEIVS